MRQTEVIASPAGNLAITHDGDTLLRLEYTRKKVTANNDLSKPASHIEKQLLQYFDDPKHQFTIPMQLDGTPFQRKVWQALQCIPTGTVATYGELAKKLQTSPRAIGNACRQNPIAIIVPCHRIVGQKSLVGYAGQTQGAGIRTKEMLINHEGSKHPH